MSDIAIKVEDLGKLYRLGEIGTGTLGHDLNRAWARLRGKDDPSARIGETNDRTAKGGSDFVWSLKDVNFEVKQGEVLGIIGRNGAGKSTLLKILSKVTAPTTGRVKVRGRIASLLEVGTGFHPELTGRENIFLNGAILGMTKVEIRSKFDEIVDFSGVERYIDTPVKRYSSGMYVRLAFAVAAFLEPEILIVDEVLAVGDAEFQKKCLGRMKDVSVNDGRTVLFVSHNMAAIQKLCTTGLLMQNGELISYGSINSVTDDYLSNDSLHSNANLFEVDKNKVAGISKIEFLDEKENSVSEIPVGNKWMIRVWYKVNTKVENLICAAGLTNPMEVAINTSWQSPLNLSPGMYRADFVQKDVTYAVGKYKVSVGLSLGMSNFQYCEDAISFDIVSIIQSVGASVMRYEVSSGAILNQLEMETRRISEGILE